MPCAPVCPFRMRRSTPSCDSPGQSSATKGSYKTERRRHSSRPRLRGHRASLGMDGEPQVDGRPWRAPGVERDVVVAVGVGARLVLADGLERFDVLPLLVATDGAIRALGA